VQFKIEIQSESIMTNSERLFEEAQKFIPGGVNSPVRAFRQVGGTPLFMKSAKGAYLVDADGKQYIDYIGSWGPMILGHSHPKVVEAIKLQVEQAVSFGAPTEQETSLAKLISQMVPGIDLIRFVNSGTEACMSALRLAHFGTTIVGANRGRKFRHRTVEQARRVRLNLIAALPTSYDQAVAGLGRWHSYE